jgi:hypothetical protein
MTINQFLTKLVIIVVLLIVSTIIILSILVYSAPIESPTVLNPTMLNGSGHGEGNPYIRNGTKAIVPDNITCIGDHGGISYGESPSYLIKLKVGGIP